jgi:anti-sigma-K factor RskA
VNCEEFEEMSGAYAIGALPEEEHARAAAHLATCEKHPEMGELQAVADSLALAAPAADPPAALKSRLMDVIHADVAAPVLGAQRDQRGSFLEAIKSWFGNARLGYGLAAAMTVLVVGLLAWNVSLQNDEPSATTVVVQMTGQASGEVVYLADKKIAVMDLHGLDELPSDKVYEVWALRDGHATSLGVIFPANGSVNASMQFDATGFDMIAVTIEDAPGVDQPTTDPISSGEL